MLTTEDIVHKVHMHECLRQERCLLLCGGTERESCSKSHTIKVRGSVQAAGNGEQHPHVSSVLGVGDHRPVHAIRSQHTWK